MMSVLQHRRKAFHGVFVTGQTLLSLRNDFTAPVGFKFTVGPVPITVTDLGRWIVSGNSASHLLALYNSGGTAIITNGSATLNTVGKTAGDFAYVALATPVVLVASTSYIMTSAEAASGDQWWNVAAPNTTTRGGVLNFANYIFGGVGNNAGAGDSYGPVNFKYR